MNGSEPGLRPTARAHGTHPAYVRGLCESLRDEGGELDTALALAGSSRAELEDGALPLTPDRLRWIVRALQRAAGRPTLALEAGARLPLAAHGALGTAMAVSANLRQALPVLLRFLPTRLPLAGYALQPASGGLWWIVTPRPELADLQSFVVDHAAASFAALVLQLTGGGTNEAVLELPMAAPPWRRAYEGLAGTVRFGTGRLAWWLPDALLDRPLPGAAAAACAAAWGACEAQEQAERTARSVRSRTERWLRSDGRKAVSLQAAAAHLGLGSRTLIRRLAAEDTAFQTLSDDWRREQALHLLQHTDTPVARIASQLGYRHASNFSRCVRRWFGCTARVLRDAPSSLHEAGL